eukprot:955827-Amphidinium_carterae.1
MSSTGCVDGRFSASHFWESANRNIKLGALSRAQPLGQPRGYLSDVIINQHKRGSFNNCHPIGLTRGDTRLWLGYGDPLMCRYVLEPKHIIVVAGAKDSSKEGAE